jgi:hypothetical protein
MKKFCFLMFLAFFVCGGNSYGGFETLRGPTVLATTGSVPDSFSNDGECPWAR